MGHPGGLGRLSRTYLLALALAAPDWELHAYFRDHGQEELLKDELPVRANGGPANIFPHYPPFGGINRLLLEEFDLPRQLGRLGLDAYLGCDFTLPPRPLASRELVVLPDLLPFTKPATVGWRARFLYRRGLRRSIGRQAALLCISQQTADVLRQVFPSHRCEARVVRPALSPRLLELAGRSRSADVPLQVRGGLNSVSAPGRYLLSVGVAGRRKNTALLVEVYRRLVIAGDYGGSLIMAGGDGSYHTARQPRKLALEAAHPLPRAAVNPAPAIHDLGHVSDSDLSQLYREADLLVSLSQEEGFGYPVLEALAHGTPALVTDGSPMAGIAAGGIATTKLNTRECSQRLKSTLAALPLLRQEVAALRLEDYSIERLGRELVAAIADEPTDGVQTE